MNLLACLQETTRDAHERLDRLPLVQAMIQGRISREDYARLLGQLWHLYAVLDSEWQRHPALREMVPHASGRHEALRRDMAVLRTAGSLLPLPATQGLLASIRQWSSDAPWALCGCLYVFEKVRLDWLKRIGPLARALDVPVAPGQGLEFHLGGPPDRHGALEQFEECMRTARLTGPERDQLAYAAAATAEALTALHAALPLRSMMPRPVHFNLKHSATLEMAAASASEPARAGGYARVYWC